MAEPSLADKVVAIDRALEGAGVAHAFGGALALAYYAEPRATVDIDVNVFVSPDRYPEVLALLEPLGVGRAPDPDQVLRDGQGRLWWGRNPLDLFFAYEPVHEAMRRAARRVPFGDARIPILAPEHLLVAKVVFDRAKDWLDIEQVLIAAPALNLGEVNRWLDHLAGPEDPRTARFRRLATDLLGRDRASGDASPDKLNTPRDRETEDDGVPDGQVGSPARLLTILTLPRGDGYPIDGLDGAGGRDVVLPQQDEEFVQRATRRFAERLAGLVRGYRGEGREPGEVLGDPEALADRALAAQAPVPSPWDERIGPFLRSEGVQARLGITRQAVAAKAARRRLLRVFTADGVALFPVWQFEDGWVVPGLPEVLALFPEKAVDGWTLAGWLRSIDVELGGVPLDLLRQGRGELVRAVARSAAAALVG